MAAEEEELLLWAASEPMQPIPLLLSAEEGGRVSLALVSRPYLCRPLEVPPRAGARGGARSVSEEFLACPPPHSHSKTLRWHFGSRAARLAFAACSSTSSRTTCFG